MYQILQEKVNKTHITALDLSTTPVTNGCRNDDDPAWPTPFAVAVSVRPDQWCVFCTSSRLFVQ